MSDNPRKKSIIYIDSDTDSGGPKGRMKKGDIVDHLAKKVGTTKKVANIFLVELVNLSYREAKKDFTIPGLGKLTVVYRKKRMGRNPATGESIVIPEKNVLKFKVSKSAQYGAFVSGKKSKGKKSKGKRK